MFTYRGLPYCPEKALEASETLLRDRLAQKPV
jgi:hypothetical protein